MTGALTKQERNWLDLIAADLRENCDKATFLADPVAAICAAHERRQAFIVEMHEGRTERARIARDMLTTVVYAEGRRKAEYQRFLDNLEEHRGEQVRARIRAYADQFDNRLFR